MSNYRYFKESEFRNAKPSCSLDDMDPDFMKKLDDARSICSVPFIISSAYRSKEYEISHARHFDGKGSHSTVPCVAVDILCSSGGDRLKILIALLAVGFRRIGVYSTFLHIDSDISKSPSIWYGK